MQDRPYWWQWTRDWETTSQGPDEGQCRYLQLSIQCGDQRDPWSAVFSPGSFISSSSLDSLKTGLGMWCGEDAFAWSVLHSKPRLEAAHLGNDGTTRCLDRTNSALTCERSPQLGLLILGFPYKRRGQGQSRDLHLNAKLLPCPTVCSSVLIARGIREQLEYTGWEDRGKEAPSMQPVGGGIICPDTAQLPQSQGEILSTRCSWLEVGVSTFFEIYWYFTFGSLYSLSVLVKLVLCIWRSGAFHVVARCVKGSLWGCLNGKGSLSSFQGPC